MNISKFTASLMCLFCLGFQLVSAQSVTVSEFNYNSDSSFSTGDWIEIWNYGSSPVDLTGWSLDDGDLVNTYTFPNGLILDPDERIVYSCDPLRFASMQPGVTNMIGDTVFRLNNGGEEIRIFNSASSVVVAFSFEDTVPWQKTPDGAGRTLELQDETADLFDPQNWWAGCMFGSPGVPYTACDPDLVFSEVNYNSAFSPNPGDWVELHNRTASSIDLSGWFFNDSRDTSLFPIPDGTVLEADAYLVIARDETMFSAVHPGLTNLVSGFDFNLSGDGEVIQLFDELENIIYSAAYNDSSPWPTEADGLGYTLEFDDETGAVEKAFNWFAGCLLGSPGRAYDPDCVNGLNTPESTFEFTAFSHNGQVYAQTDASIGEVQYSLYDLNGRVLAASIPVIGERVVLGDAIPKGIYFVRAYSDDG
ncbi:MAG: hypothetical protein ACI959_000238, partial [Limisphaerales bacterium]